MEIWKDIKGYEGLYQVSNLGKVKSLSRFIRNNKNYSSIGFYSKERILKCWLDGKKQYLRVALSKNNHIKTHTIHRLVAETFLDNSSNKREVNHIDGNKQNNCASNLEWVTSKENKEHAVNSGLIKRKLNQNDIDYVRKYYIPFDKEFGQRGLARKFNVEHKVIARIISHKDVK